MPTAVKRSSHKEKNRSALSGSKGGTLKAGTARCSSSVGRSASMAGLAGADEAGAADVAGSGGTRSAATAAAGGPSVRPEGTTSDVEAAGAPDWASAGGAAPEVASAKPSASSEDELSLAGRLRPPLDLVDFPPVRSMV